MFLFLLEKTHWRSSVKVSSDFGNFKDVLCRNTTCAARFPPPLEKMLQCQKHKLMRPLIFIAYFAILFLNTKNIIVVRDAVLNFPLSHPQQRKQTAFPTMQLAFDPPRVFPDLLLCVFDNLSISLRGNTNTAG